MSVTDIVSDVRTKEAQVAQTDRRTVEMNGRGGTVRKRQRQKHREGKAELGYDQSQTNLCILTRVSDFL